MRAVVKLEKRFRHALEKLDAGGTAQADDKENANLSNRIENLEASGAEKEAKIKALDAEIARLTESEAAAVKHAAELKAAEDTVKKEVATLQAAIEKAKATEAATALQLADLKSQMKSAGDGDASTVDVAVLAELKAKLETSEATAEGYLKRISSLRGSLRQIRAGVKDNVLNAETVNTAMQAELEALQAQREMDLNEVNIILEKLTPLVEGK
jgi:chromosome segregation ATPase